MAQEAKTGRAQAASLLPIGVEAAWVDAYTAQQEQPRAPKKPFRSDTGTFAPQARAWS